MSTQSFAVNRTVAIAPATVELDELNELQAILEPPEPRSGRGQQVLRLEQLGLRKAAQAVSACGRLGEKYTYECGRSVVGNIIRAHRRFCCSYCDLHVFNKLSAEHQAYGGRLHQRGALFSIIIGSFDSSLSSNNIRSFEDGIVEAVRRMFGDQQGWGFKGYTSYESGQLVVKAIVYTPPGMLLVPDDLTIPGASCIVGPPEPVGNFKDMLATILRPTIADGFGRLRAELMAAFQKGNHLRSLGAFYGEISKNRQEKPQVPNSENLHLIQYARDKADAYGVSVAPETLLSGAASLGTSERISLPPLSSGAGLLPPRGTAYRYLPPCTLHGHTCKLVSVTVEPLSAAIGTQFGESTMDTLGAG